MDFYTASKNVRPIRLSEKTREFAYESLHFRYGREISETPYVSVEDIKDLRSLPLIKQYDIAIRRIAETAPLRICENELISGSATLGDARLHVIPAKYSDGYVMGSMSHLTLDFFTVVDRGYAELERRAKESYEKFKGTDREDFCVSVLETLRSLEIYHERYIELLKSCPDKADNYRNLLRVPKYGAVDFYEAVQSLWFVFSFVRLCGNWPGIGRIDELLGKYLKKDLTEGKITLDRAREILAHFFIKGCEWIKGGDYGSGDAQHYQNIVLSGVDENGNDVTNEVSWLTLEIIDELGISDFPVSVRLNSRSDPKFVEKTAESIAFGGGIVAVYNEDLIIKSLTDYGYELKEARNFANDGCWEIQIPGKTRFCYIPFDGLAILQHITLKNYENIEFDDYEELYSAFVSDLNEQMNALYENEVARLMKRTDDGKFYYENVLPTTVISIFENDCIVRGRGYFEGGCVYSISSPHFGGFADVCNALYAIKKAVFDEKKVTFAEFMNAIRDDWNGAEVLRAYVLNKYVYFGNDNDEVDGIAACLTEDFAEACGKLNNKSPIMFPPGISTFGRQIAWVNSRLASPHGRKKGEILSGNASPTPATDKEGATAVIKSYCKCPLGKIVNGAALDVHLYADQASGKSGIAAIVGLIRGFLAQGGQFMQIDVADKQVLLAAREHPENYPTLSVRVSGWNARFVTLDKEWQDMIIERL